MARPDGVRGTPLVTLGDEHVTVDDPQRRQTLLRAVAPVGLAPLLTNASVSGSALQLSPAVDGVRLRRPPVRLAGPLPESLPASDAVHPDLTSHVTARFLGTARHRVTERQSVSESRLSDKEQSLMRGLLGPRAPLHRQTVPPSRTDQGLLQRLLNLALPNEPPLTVDNAAGPETRARLRAYRVSIGLPESGPRGELLDAEVLARLGRAGEAARVADNPRLPAPPSEQDPQSQATRSATGLLDVLSREDPVRYGRLLRRARIANPDVNRTLTGDEVQRLTTFIGRRLPLDDNTATRMRLAQPEEGRVYEWSHEGARIVADVLTGALDPNRSGARIATYRRHAEQARYGQHVPRRIMELDALVESGFRHDLVVRRTTAAGYHQLTDEVSRHYGVTNPLNPVQNVRGGELALRDHYDQMHARLYPGRPAPRGLPDRNDPAVWRLVFVANNAGPRRVDRYQDVPPFRETTKHLALLAWYNATFERR